MGIRKITAIMLLGALLFGSLTAKAQEKPNRWEPTAGLSGQFGLFSANKEWKTAMGARPAGLSGGFGCFFGVKYGKMRLLVYGDYANTYSYTSGNSSEKCVLSYSFLGMKIGYDFGNYVKGGTEYGFTFLTGLLLGIGELGYEFESEFDKITLLQARDLSVTFRQNAIYVPLEIRWHHDAVYIGLAYMLNVSRGDVNSGHNIKAKIIDAPNINILPVQLSIGIQL